MNYYNEFDPKAAAWLRELISAGAIPPGKVDERDMRDVQPNDLHRFTQHHFFAGIGGWSLALKLAGWPENKPVATASLPCQPFSAAGNQKGKDDERHLFPHFMQLVKRCGFNTIFGEQVATAIKYGWLDDLQTSMEGEGYTVGHCVLGAHSVNAPHQRQRLFWVSHYFGTRSQRGLSGRKDQERQTLYRHIRCDSATCWICRTEHNGSSTSEIAGGDAKAIQRCAEEQNSTVQLTRTGEAGMLAADDWHNVEWRPYADGKHRPVKPGIFPLADGVPADLVYQCCPGSKINATQEARVMRIRGYGNAIVPQVAAEFISAFMEVMNA